MGETMFKLPDDGALSRFGLAQKERVNGEKAQNILACGKTPAYRQKGCRLAVLVGPTMTQFPCPRCKAILTASEHQTQISCSACKHLVPVPSALPDWATTTSQPSEGLPDWLAGAATPPPPPRKEPAVAEETLVAVLDRPAKPDAAESTIPPVPLPPRPQTAPTPLPVKWIAAGAVAGGGLLLVLTIGVVALAASKVDNGKQEIANAREDRDEGQPTKPNNPGVEPAQKVTEKQATPVETEREAKPVEQPRDLADAAEILPTAPRPLVEEPPAALVEKKPVAPPTVKEPIVKSPPEEEEIPPPPKMATIAARPRELSQNAKTSISFLIKQQQADGGWSGGEAFPFGGGFGFGFGGAQPGKKGDNPTTDPANTSVAALALLRAGYSPQKGTHSEALRKAIDSVCKAVEKADEDALSLTGAKEAVGPGRMAFKGGTLVQTKIGPSVDTYLAGMLLAEARGKMPNAAGEKRVYNALKKVTRKLETHQKDDGSWGDAAWAPVLGQALASRALNRAGQVGLPVDTTKLARAARHAHKNLDNASKGRMGLMGAAGIALYAVASGIGGLHDAAVTRKQAAEGAKGILNSPSATESEKAQAREQIKQANDSEKAFLTALRSVARNVNNQGFVRGFGTDGGEEFISFALIAEALRAKLPKDWAAWDRAIRTRLTRAQNRDGSWSGSHCITGKTFCTASALMAMMGERAPVPASAQEK
jgi:hypothetical protein